LKLLFDENLSPRLVELLSAQFPDSTHVHNIGLGSADDEAVWRHAEEHGFVICTKDADFQERAVVALTGPKIVWIRRGNCTTSDLAAILLRHTDDIKRLAADPTAAILVLV
jgi:predicted nuclease of predicted toxin-antitoxin system